MDRSERLRLHRVVLSQGCAVVEVFGGDPPGWNGFAMAQRQTDGTVSFAIHAREAREAGFASASGGVAFELLLRAARDVGPVPAILGEWHPSSDNFKEFKRLRATNGPAPDAALGTFTGREAARQGYGHVAALEEGDEVVRVRFEPGAGR